MKLIYNYISLEKSIWNQNFNGVFTCIFAKVRKPCLPEHPAVRLSEPNLTTSTACWTTWPVMREKRPGSNAWCVGVMCLLRLMDGRKYWRKLFIHVYLYQCWEFMRNLLAILNIDIWFIKDYSESFVSKEIKKVNTWHQKLVVSSNFNFA